MVATRPEIELLWYCVRTCEDSERAAQIKAVLGQELDWAYLLRTASLHRVMPLLYQHLNNTCPEAVPEVALGQLRDYFHESARRSFFLTGELLKLLNLFEAHKIPAIPYKGPTLAAFAYGNLAIRDFGDLDILVRRQDVTRAKEVLVSLGYRPWHQLNPAQEAALLRWHCERIFRRKDGSSVELHWAFTPREISFPLDLEHLWDRRERISIGGATVPTLSPEDLLLILCVHGSKHLWGRLIWICDLAELIRVHKGMDWERLMERASALGSERMLSLGLFLASDLLGAVLPEEVLRRVQADLTAKALAGQVREWFFQGWVYDVREYALEESYFFEPFYWRMRERTRDKIRYCVRRATLTNVRDWKFLPLPTYLFPLYHVIRPIRLIRKYGEGLWKLWKRLA